jgi:tetratricopeptide (TPR) repeat protein
MPLELSTDLLVISRYAEPPAPGTIAGALDAARLGTCEYRPPLGASTGGERERLGSHLLAAPRLPVTGRVRLTRHREGALSTMGEAAFATLTRGLSPDDAQTLLTGTMELSLSVSMGDSVAIPALNWAMQVLRVLLDVTEGAAVDPAAQRCYGRAALQRFNSDDPLAHVAFHNELWNADSRWLHTHGLQKYGRPELDLAGVPISLEDDGAAFLRDVAESLARGATLVAGQEIVWEELGAVVAIGVPSDVDHQAPYGRLRLADPASPGERQSGEMFHLLVRMALAEATRRLAGDELPAALEAIERALAADPDDCGALALKARVYLRAGQPVPALELGELMQLRSPGDYRGPLVVGMALATMGRYQEALIALDRSIDREPEAADAFAARAEVHALMGHQQLASVDRARAAYLLA